MTKRPRRALYKTGHDITEHFEEGGCHVTYDKTSILNPGWTKNIRMDRTSGKMSQGQIVRADGSLSGWIVWVKMSLSQFVGGRIDRAPVTRKSAN